MLTFNEFLTEKYAFKPTTMKDVDYIDNAKNMLANAEEMKVALLKKNPDKADRINKLFSKFLSRFSGSGYKPDEIRTAFENMFKTFDKEGISR